MKIKLLDYLGQSHYVDISDDEQSIDIEIISGDMVMTKPIYYDCCENRMFDFHDGKFTITRDKFEEFNNIERTYDIYDLL